MLLHQLAINSLSFAIGFIGVTINYNSILTTLMGIELMLLTTSLNFITYSIYLDDIYGQIFSLSILTVAASESAIGLAILIVMYKIVGNIDMNTTSSTKG